MSIVLRASKWAPEVTAFGFTSLNITHRVSNVRSGKDTFELSFTDQQGQDYSIKLYSESPNTDIVVDDGTDERIVHTSQVALPRGVDLLDAKKFLAACKTYRGDFVAESAAKEIEEKVIDI